LDLIISFKRWAEEEGRDIGEVVTAAIPDDGATPHEEVEEEEDVVGK
jgi:hypothetical protein